MKFYWGAGTSSHQVEGGMRNDWGEWEAHSAKSKVESAKLKEWPGYILKNYPNPLQEENYVSGRACDHYNRFKEDFDMAKSLGHNAHRFSLEWSRIEPEEGQFDEKEIEHYRHVILALKERGLEPFVTVWHYTLPLWLSQKGGVLNKKFGQYFAGFTKRMVQEYGRDVTFWTTINEPEVYAITRYFFDQRPIFYKLIPAYFRIIRRLITAHRIAYAAVKEAMPSAQVGIVCALSHVDSKGGLINNTIKAAIEKMWNHFFLKRVSHYIDFIGLNHYFHTIVNYGVRRNFKGKLSDMKWELYPEGLYRVLKSLKQYQKPIYITEHGLADARDAHREWYIREGLVQVGRARKEGVDVRGYFHWSLLDNFEWAEGFWPRFGLVAVNYKTLQRTVRPSALAYKKIIEEHPDGP
jgi:beta-glucosidase